MDIFYALAEPTRRHIIEVLASEGQLAASDISSRFNVSPPAISQHLKVLRETNVVNVEKKAQQRIYTINPTAFSELEEWTKKMMDMWGRRFDDLEKLIEKTKRAN